MHTGNSMTTTGIVLTVGLLLGLAGCAASPPGGGAPPEEGAARPAGPHPLLSVGCEELLDDATLAAAFGSPLPARSPHVEGYGGMGNVAVAALALAGATRCAWGDEQTFLEVDVLPAAATEWAALEAELRMFQPQQAAHGEGAWLGCGSGDRLGCDADLLAGGHWVAVDAQGLSSSDALDAVLARLATVVASADAGEADWAVTPVTADCGSLLPLESVRAALGGDLGVWTDRGAVLSKTLRQAALDRVGAVHCSWRNGFDSATARTVELTVLPGGDLVWDAHFAAPVPAHVARDALEGVGDAAFSAVVTSAASGKVDGSASALTGASWVDVWTNDEARTDDRDPAVTLVADVVGRTTP